MCGNADGAINSFMSLALVLLDFRMNEKVKSEWVMTFYFQYTVPRHVSGKMLFFMFCDF